MSREHVRRRIALNYLSQEQVARAAGYEPSLFRPHPAGPTARAPDFAPRVTAALDRLERAEKAAAEARARVLSGGAA